MALKRRTFLQQTGLALTALGLGEVGLLRLTDRYHQALAQPTARKLALLVGINQYPESVCDFVPQHGSALSGCLTDVELQRELLIHRFGFQAADIVTLTDQAATREGIEAAFVDHLIQQAEPGDLVLFHFSGLGSQLRLDGTTTQLQSLVPIDGTLPTPEVPILRDLLQETLGLLLNALPTQRVVAVIDAGYSQLGHPLQGNLRVRSRPDTPVGLVSAAELAFQERLRSMLRSTVRLSQAQMNQQWQTGQLPGLVLQASAVNRLATEVQWNGFSAGLFTYALTQQLWQSMPETSVLVSFQQASATVKQTAGLEQQPLVLGKFPPQSLTGTATGAEGLIRATDDEGKIQLWLAGLPADVLEHAVGSWFAVVNDADAAAPTLLQLRSRDGLIGQTRGAAVPVQPGQLVQEQVRVLPRSLELTVALDSSLKRIERVDATSAFSAIPRVAAVLVGEQPADLLFGKTQQAPLIVTSLPAKDGNSAGTTPPTRYGLFDLAQSAVPGTLNQNSEAVKAAVTRLTPQFKALLAMKLIRLTQNQGSSRLGIQASLVNASASSEIILQQATLRSAQPSLVSAKSEPRPEATVAVGQAMQYQLTNTSDQPIYYLLIGREPKGTILLFYPAPEVPNANAAAQSALAAGETILIPPPGAKNWLAQKPVGLAETYLICSRAPFVQTAQFLKTGSTAPVMLNQVIAVSNPLEVAQAILQDLHQASSVTLSDIPPDSYALDVNAWATLSFVHQIVEG